MRIRGIRWASPLAAGLGMALPLQRYLPLGMDIAKGRDATEAGAGNALTFDVMPEIGGYAMRGDGSDRYLSLRSLLEFMTNGEGSISAWVKTDADNADNGLWSLGNGESRYDYSSGLWGHAALTTFGTTTGNMQSVDTSQPHLLTITVAPGGRWTSYIDGKQWAAASLTFVTSHTTWKLGASATSSTYALAGLMAHFLAWDRALSAEEVWSLYDPASRWDVYDFAPVMVALFSEQPAGTTVNAAAGSILYTGHAATVNVATGVASAAGAVNYAGQAAIVNAGTSVDANAGAVAYSGQAATVNAAADVAANAGAIAYTGQAASVNTGAVVASAAGSVVYTGQQSSINAATDVASNAGAIAYTGQAASVTTGATVAANAGSVAYTGQSATVNAAADVAANAGAVAYTGQSASVNTGTTVAANAGAVAYTGQAASVNAQRQIDAAAGAITYTGLGVTVNTGGALVTVAAGAIAYTANAATVATGIDVGAGRTITVAAGDRTISVESGARTIYSVGAS